MRAAVVVSVVLLFSGLVTAQEGSSCVTPLGDPGLCINIKRCEGLVMLLRTQSNNPEVRNYLLRSTCGYAGNMPLVCCPQITSQFRTTTQAPVKPPPQTGGTIVTGGGLITGGIGNPTGNTGSGITTGNTGNTGNPGPTTTVPRSPGDVFYRAPQCGRSENSTTRVVGGVPASLGEFPWMVALGYTNNKNPSQPKWLCGGTLITYRHILTAGHCVFNRPDLFVAKVGDLDLYSDDDGATPEIIPLIKAKVHEGYSSTKYTNDIAILTMERKPVSASVWPICLPVVEPYRSNNFENYNGFVAGWGALYFNGPTSSTLLKAILPVVGNAKCKEKFAELKQVIDDRVLCAGVTDGKRDACQGDSGGPLMYGFHSPDSAFPIYYQIGVVSYGFKCAEIGFPGVYTRVTRYTDWISKQINLN